MQQWYYRKFGLWLDHRASLLFYNNKEVQQLQEKLTDIDLSLDQVLLLNDKTNWEKLAEETEKLNNLITSTDWLLAQVSKDLAAMVNSKDPLTRMFTRRYLPSIIQQEIHYCLENNVCLGVIMVDLDHFKRINDQFGHAVGDTVLNHIASLLQASIRAYDYVFRYGGEEFLILINNTDQASCLSIAEEIRKKIEISKIHELPLLNKPVTVSLGVALFDKHPDYERLIKHADDALYSAKEKGRNRVELFRAENLGSIAKK